MREQMINKDSTELEDRACSSYPPAGTRREDVVAELRHAEEREVAACLRYLGNPTDSVKKGAPELIVKLNSLTHPIKFCPGKNSLDKIYLLAVLRFSRTDAQLIRNVANWLCTQGALRREEDTFECLAMIFGVDWQDQRKIFSSLLHTPHGAAAYVPTVCNQARTSIIKRVRQFYPDYQATLENSYGLLAPQKFLEDLFSGFIRAIEKPTFQDMKQAYIWINNLYIKRKGEGTREARLATYYKREAQAMDIANDSLAWDRLRVLIATQIQQLEPTSSTMLKPLLKITFPEALLLAPEMKLAPREEADGCCTTRFLRPF